MNNVIISKRQLYFKVKFKSKYTIITIEKENNISQKINFMPQNKKKNKKIAS